MRNVAVAVPGVLTALIAVRGSTSESVLYEAATGPAGGLSGPAWVSSAAAKITAARMTVLLGRDMRVLRMWRGRRSSIRQRRSGRLAAWALAEASSGRAADRL